MANVPYPGFEDQEYDEELSFKDFTGWEFLSRPEIDFNNKIIYGSCFSNENPDSEIFSSKTSTATFIKCNLSNVVIPDGNTVIDCIETSFERQNDLRDWEIDEKGEPIAVLNEKYWESVGVSIDPKDIPDVEIVIGKDKTLEDQLKQDIPIDVIPIDPIDITPIGVIGVGVKP